MGSHLCRQLVGTVALLAVTAAGEAQDFAPGKDDGRASEEHFQGGAAAVACIFNETGLLLRFSVRWGEGAWDHLEVGPDGHWTLWWPYSPERAARGDYSRPSLQLRLDTDLSDAYRESTWDLAPYVIAKPSCEGARHYALRPADPSGRWIGLADRR